MTRPDIAAIVWAPHEARTEAFARWLNAPLHNVHFLKERRPLLAPLKYVMQAFATWWILLRDRPAHVFVTNSPPVAGLCVMAYCVLTGTGFVLDVHPPSLYSRKWAWARPVQRFTSRFARAVLVDQERVAQLFRSWGAEAIVLRNPPKERIDTTMFERSDADRRTFVYIGTFAQDEPVEIIFEAAERVPDVRFYLLGNPELAPRHWIREAPDNVSFTGYVVGEDYWRRLDRAAGIIVLTTHAHSLLGGAQDGMHIGRPLLLSDQPALREYFTSGTVFIENTADGLVDGVETVLRRGAELEREIVDLREETDARWQRDFARLEELLGTRRRGTSPP